MDFYYCFSVFTSICFSYFQCKLVLGVLLSINEHFQRLLLSRRKENTFILDTQGCECVYIVKSWPQSYTKLHTTAVIVFFADVLFWENKLLWINLSSHLLFYSNNGKFFNCHLFYGRCDGRSFLSTRSRNKDSCWMYLVAITIPVAFVVTLFICIPLDRFHE